jgi:tetratricopeptide (TPR) repeat protein
VDLRRELLDIQARIKLYLGAGRPDAAEKLARAALADHGPLANIHNTLGVVYYSQSRFPEALREFRKSLQINPAYIEAGLNLVAALCDLSCYEEARRVYADILQQVPQGRKQTQLVLGRLADRHGQSGRMYEDSGMIQDAIHEYRRALALYDQMPDVRLALARALVKVGQRDKALTELEELIKRAPNQIDARIELGILYFKLGRVNEARGQWETVRQMEPTNRVARVYLDSLDGQPR